MAASIDADGTIKITGGTVIVVGYAGNFSTSGVTKTTSTSGLTKGDHTVTIGSSVITYTNDNGYSGKVTVYGSGTATIS